MVALVEHTHYNNSTHRDTAVEVSVTMKLKMRDHINRFLDQLDLQTVSDEWRVLTREHTLTDLRPHSTIKRGTNLEAGDEEIDAGVKEIADEVETDSQIAVAEGAGILYHLK